MFCKWKVKITLRWYLPGAIHNLLDLVELIIQFIEHTKLLLAVFTLFQSFGIVRKVINIEKLIIMIIMIIQRSQSFGVMI